MHRSYLSFSLPYIPMPFEFLPATRSMDARKRKKEHDDAENRRNPALDAGKQSETVTDEEVEEFYAILRRLHAATKHLKKIDGASGLLIGTRSKPSSEAKASDEDADEVIVGGDKAPTRGGGERLCLDLNLAPAAPSESDVQEWRKRVENPDPLTRSQK